MDRFITLETNYNFALKLIVTTDSFCFFKWYHTNTITGFQIILQHQKVTVVSHDTPKSTKGNEIRITKVSSKKAAEERKASTEVVAVKESPAAEPVKQTESPAFNPSPVPHQPPVVEGPQ